MCHCFLSLIILNTSTVVCSVSSCSYPSLFLWLLNSSSVSRVVLLLVKFKERVEMADALVSAVLNTISDNLNSLSREGIRLAGSLKTEVQTLESTLTTIQAVLHDAEQKQWKSKAIQNWLGKLKQAAYDPEDVLDDFNAEALRQRDARSKVTVLFSPQNPLLFRLNMAHKLKDTREKLDAIAEERSKFHLREGVAEAETGRNRDRITSSLVNESADNRFRFARHLFVHSSSFSRNTLDLSELEPLRSLILGNKFTFRGFANLYNPSHFISKQKHLKVLDLGYNFCNIAFKSLNHLRYLCLHDGNMKTLPESTSSLHNLQTLNLRSCDNLQMLPKGMKHLENLRYLDLRECYKLSSMPIGLGQLSSLRKLNKFVVGKDNDSGGIDELKELDIEGELSITGLDNVKSATEAKNSNLINKQNLRSLSLSWRRDSDETSQHGNDEEILNALQPHSSLKKLYIYGYQGVRFPYWMMDMLLPNLVQISLEYRNRCYQLPPLGKLRFLKVLTIFGMGALKYIDSNFNGDMESSFPSLEVLKILWAPCLEEWTVDNGRHHFPILTSLTIIGCPMLVKLPMLQSLKELDIRGSSVTLLKSLMMNATVLISLHIWEFYELRVLSDLLDNLFALKHLNLKSCSQLESLHAGLQNLSSLETLELSHCNSLV
ncbi:hypothetical protein CXB51_015978 [Gossypium anomalum]|uniref:Rx N-terminal domain-containing protein n=1 Tax=Gossypium anomalum TaxID=47600 RepID=A0A8J5YU44_9ROSI|nr:hypothetical protein CXB51_015978 [Gossypium anomalum]